MRDNIANHIPASVHINTDEVEPAPEWMLNSDEELIKFAKNNGIHKDVTIGDNVWIGSRVIILGGIIIGEGAVIQAGSVVSNDVPKYSIMGGNPAKEFKSRDIDHYNKLYFLSNHQAPVSL